ncbi:MAG: hypothetical protein ABIH04_04360 [Planctomycetota bacterium]
MQNKPNFLMPKTNATSCAAKSYTNIPLRAAPGKQTQSNPTCRGEAYGKAGPVAAKPDLSRRSLWRSRIKPNFPSVYAIRDTQYAIRDTTSGIRTQILLSIPYGNNNLYGVSEDKEAETMKVSIENKVLELIEAT